MYLVLEEFRNQEGCFSVLDYNGNERHIWMSNYIKKTAPWRWWLLVASNNYPKFAKFAAKILQIVINSSSCERIFSVWGAVCTKLRNRLSVDKQRKSLYCYVNWRLMASAEKELYRRCLIFRRGVSVERTDWFVVIT